VISATRDSSPGFALREQAADHDDGRIHLSVLNRDDDDRLAGSQAGIAEATGHGRALRQDLPTRQPAQSAVATVLCETACIGRARKRLGEVLGEGGL
jgi:hypothetical protein